MNKLVHLVVLVAALTSSLAVLSSTAGAVTWHNTGSTAFTATAGLTSFTATGPSLGCGSGTMTGAVSGTPFVGASWVAFTGTMVWSSCLITGAASVDCGYAFTAQSASGSSTSGTIGMTCSVYQSGTKVCHIAGALTGSYINPTGGATAGKLTLNTGGNLTTSNGAAGTCPLGANDRGHFNALTFTVTNGTPSTLGPDITRTA